MHTYTPTKRFWLLVFANVVFVIHFALVVSNIIGWLFPGFIFYVFLVTWTLAFSVDILIGTCPLTRLEFGIRRKLNPSIKLDRTCIGHYLRTWRGLAPRPSIKIEPKTFWQRYSFSFVYIAILSSGLLWQSLVYGRDIFYFA